MKIKQATKQGWIEWLPGTIADCSYPTSKLRRARVQWYESEEKPYIYMQNLCPTLQACNKDLYYQEKEGDLTDMEYRIRKLTPRECWRLMGFEDKDFDKSEKVNSSTQLYKQAGNSIVVNVLMAIFGQMIPNKENVYKTYKQDFFANDVENKSINEKE